MRIGDLEICFRDYRIGDLNFIRDSWLESFRAAHAAGTLSDQLYFPAYRANVNRLLTRSHCVVAFNAEEENQDLGWICLDRHEPRLVHYLFVKSFARRNGLARALMLAVGLDPAQGFTYTHKTPATSKLPWNGRWDPTLARREPKEPHDPQSQENPLPGIR